MDMKKRRKRKMNQYKQEYMTEFGYILGTMQKEYGNIIDKFPPKITENQDGIKIFNEFVEFFVDKFLSSKSRDYEEFIKENIDEVKKEFTEIERVDKWKNIFSLELKYYNELEPYERVHLTDFEILNSINNILDKPDLKTQERLLNIIKNVWLKDENHISESKIADEICSAYKSKQISLDSLEKANSRNLLQCVYGYDKFSLYNTNIVEQYEYIEKLYNKANNTEYKNEEFNVIVVEEGVLIGFAKDIINYLDDENEHLKRITSRYEDNYDTLIKNGEIILESIKENTQNEDIVGIKYDNVNGCYNIMQNLELIEQLEEIVEECQEEDYEEEQ